MGYCRKCNEKWTGLRVCHCTGCHRTFGGVDAFDRHRLSFKCVDPVDVGMRMDAKGHWGLEFIPRGRLKIVQTQDFGLEVGVR